MTRSSTVALVERYLAGWRREEIKALADRNETRARECRLRVDLLQQLQHDLADDPVHRSVLTRERPN